MYFLFHLYLLKLNYKFCVFLSFIDVVNAQYKKREFAGIYLYNWSKRNICKAYIEFRLMRLHYIIPYHKSAHFSYLSLVKTMSKSEILD